MHQCCSGFFLALPALFLGVLLNFVVATPSPTPFLVLLELIAVFSSLVSRLSFVRLCGFLGRRDSVTRRGRGVGARTLLVMVPSSYPSIFLTDGFLYFFLEVNGRFEVGTRRGNATSLPPFLIEPCWLRLCIHTTSGKRAKRCV